MKKLIVIGGPTASGKTSLAIDLAIHFNTSILSADSRQCYRELNIGVAKPSEAELEKVPHYFINSHSILEEVSAGMYEKYALEKLELIFEKSDYAICVGGTGMYLKALIDGLDEMPPVDASIRQEIDEKYHQNGLAWLQKTLAIEDPVFFLNSEQQNPARLLRALSFKLSHGISINEFKQQHKKARSFHPLCFALEIERSQLYHQINARVDEMISQGLEDEVRALISFKQLSSLHTVGYTELFSYFDGQLTLEQSISKIKQHTRNYAKRQVTWFKHQGQFKTMKREKIVTELLTINN